MQAGSDIVTDMTRGPEAYLQTWERAYGIQSDACSTPAYKHSAAYFRTALHAGQDWWSVLTKVGQPHRRVDQRFTYCTTSGSLAVNFDKAGHLTSIS